MLLYKLYLNAGLLIIAKTRTCQGFNENPVTVLDIIKINILNNNILSKYNCSAIN